MWTISIRRAAKFIILFLAVIANSCSPVDERHRVSTNNDEFSIVFTGDVLLDRGVRKQIERKGIDHIFSAVKDSFLAADATVINLECPLTDVYTPVMKKYIFKADEKWAASLKQYGVTHAAMANNHTYDQGSTGLLNTVRALKDNDIIPMGFGFMDEERVKPVELEKNGIKVALFNSVFLRLENWIQTDGEPGICMAKGNELANQISSYKQKHPDTKIIAVVHWGVEFMPYPSHQQQMDAMLLATAGADVIVGHHPHIVQPVRTIQNCTVIYSLGNFVFDQKRADGNVAQMAKVTFGKKETLVNLYDVDIVNCRPEVVRNRNNKQ